MLIRCYRFTVRLIEFHNLGQLISSADYDGVGLSSQNANSKAAASQASKIFQDYYPELLVSHSHVER